MDAKDLRIAELEAENERLRRAIDKLIERVALLEKALEDSRRSGKRQAAPFRKEAPKPDPKPPGRKSGPDHGEHHRRAIPPAASVDETIDVPLPASCPFCDGVGVDQTHVVEQFQVEIPRRAIHRKFVIRVGRCRTCRRRVQGRHALQTSNAVGAAASQLGPNLAASLAILNKEFGLSHGKAAGVMKQLFGVSIARATSVRIANRLALRLKPAFEQIKRDVRGSPRVVCDETGWRIGGENAWLHVATTGGDGPRDKSRGATCYLVDRSRGAGPTAEILGDDYAGVMIHDGWSPYDGFVQARHQQCLAHLMRRCRELLETATRGVVRFPRAVLRTLRAMLALRDRRDRGELGPRATAILRGRLRAELRRLVGPIKSCPPNERLAKHLERHLDDCFTFLAEPEVDATNWRAEQALRPAVVNRKVWGGNRTDRGAEIQSILASVIRTCRQRALDPLDRLSLALRSPSLRLISP